MEYRVQSHMEYPKPATVGQRSAKEANSKGGKESASPSEGKRPDSDSAALGTESGWELGCNHH